MENCLTDKSPLGSVGYFTSWLFIRKIYRSIKID